MATPVARSPGSFARAAALRPVTGPAAITYVAVLIAGAWLAAVLLQLTGHASALHHHALIEGASDGEAPPLWLGIPIFLVAWQVMIAAMMLPASVRAVRVTTSSRLVRRPGPALGGFLGAYSLAWTAFGLAAFVGDIGLHHLVDATPWLAARPWLVQAGVLTLAGTYQLLPVRRRALEACRHPRAQGADAPVSDAAAGFRSGLRHAIDCLVCSWALMLLMFAAGFANLVWMAVLAAVMAYEALGISGRRVGLTFGLVLLCLASVAGNGVVLGF